MEDIRDIKSSFNNHFYHSIFHEGISARVIAGQEFMESIRVCYLLCQGCKMTI